MKNTMSAVLVALLVSVSLNVQAKDVEGTVTKIEQAYTTKFENTSPSNLVEDNGSFSFRSERQDTVGKNFITIADNASKLYTIEADSKYQVVKGQRIIIEIQ